MGLFPSNGNQEARGGMVICTLNLTIFYAFKLLHAFSSKFFPCLFASTESLEEMPYDEAGYAQASSLGDIEEEEEFDDLDDAIPSEEPALDITDDELEAEGIPVSPATPVITTPSFRSKRKKPKVKVRKHPSPIDVTFESGLDKIEDDRTPEPIVTEPFEKERSHSFDEGDYLYPEDDSRTRHHSSPENLPQHKSLDEGALPSHRGIHC